MSAERRPGPGRGGEVRAAAAAPRSPPLPPHLLPACCVTGVRSHCLRRRGSHGQPAAVRSAPGARGGPPFSRAVAGLPAGPSAPPARGTSTGAGGSHRALNRRSVRDRGENSFGKGRSAGEAQLRFVPSESLPTAWQGNPGHNFQRA